MTQRLKRWESPRRQGRNDKGKGGSARARQLKKQRQMLRQKLKENGKTEQQNQQEGRELNLLPLFLTTRRLEVRRRLWLVITTADIVPLKM